METTISPKSRLAALLLALFAGGLGLHRFYVGKNGSASAMLVMSILIIGIPVSAVWALIDVFKIASGSFTDSEGRVLKTF